MSSLKTSHLLIAFVFSDALSISGSETDDSSNDSEEITDVSISILKSDTAENIKFNDDRRPRFYFRNTDDQIISIYKKVICNYPVSNTAFTTF